MSICVWLTDLKILRIHRCIPTVCFTWRSREGGVATRLFDRVRFERFSVGPYSRRHRRHTPFLVPRAIYRIVLRYNSYFVLDLGALVFFDYC